MLGIRALWDRARPRGEWFNALAFCIRENVGRTNCKRRPPFFIAKHFTQTLEMALEPPHRPSGHVVHDWPADHPRISTATAK